mgnify:CR=1 FL=1
MFDLVIRGGTVVDGTGAPAAPADVAVKDGRIVEVRPGIDGEAAVTIDASGRVLTPGFVDIHTHYDGQVTWDSLLEPSSGHGVTTLVAGNCGVGFAPVHPGSEEWLVQLMEGVEDIPGTALHEGITWGWESFPQYLDLLDSRRWSVDVAAYVAHGPVRAYVMGQRGARNEEATPEDVAAMSRIVREAVEAGAMGFSTSRTTAHRARDGEPVPGTFATRAELNGLAQGLLDAGGGVFEIAPQGLEFEPAVMRTELDWILDLARDTGLATSFLLMQSSVKPRFYRETLDRVSEANATGARVIPQVAGRPFGMMLGWASYHPFGLRPTYRSLAASLPHNELLAELRKPAVRAAILAEADQAPDPTVRFDGIPLLFHNSWGNIFEMGAVPDYEPTVDHALDKLAADRGVSPQELAYDLMNELNGGSFLMLPFFNYVDGNHDAIREMLLHDSTVSGLSDGGAHCRMICDASMPTYMLTHWARDRWRGPKLTLEQAVKLQTSDTAAVVGLGDRGVIAPGKRADLNVIDFERLTLGFPTAADDLPAGGRRLVQGASGYDATIVAGVVTRRFGIDTGARPGRLVRRAG